jgi:hypothetical protein
VIVARDDEAGLFEFGIQPRRTDDLSAVELGNEKIFDYRIFHARECSSARSQSLIAIAKPWRLTLIVRHERIPA